MNVNFKIKRWGSNFFSRFLVLCSDLAIANSVCSFPQRNLYINCLMNVHKKFKIEFPNGLPFQHISLTHDPSCIHTARGVNQAAAIITFII